MGGRAAAAGGVIIGCVACATAPEPAPPRPSMVIVDPPSSKATASAPEPPAPVAASGTVLVRIELKPYHPAICQGREAGDEAWVDLKLRDGDRLGPLAATLRSGETAKVAPGSYLALAFHRVGERTVPVRTESLTIGAGETEQLAIVVSVPCGEGMEPTPSEEPIEPPECREAVDCMLGADGQPRPVRTAVERARRASFRPCDTGEKTAGCQAGRCIAVHYRC